MANTRAREGDQLAELYRSIDKFDKVGADGVREELVKRGVQADVVTRIMELVTARHPASNSSISSKR
ncbi:MAG: hypothetical protein IPK17_20825 [Chloroflexi bacterium]|nr:hypothetical protein [Chloroflexota bacterium]